MKIAAFILASLIIFLTAQPLLSYANNQNNMCLEKVRCCEEDGCEVPKQNNPDDCSKSCNPFIFCSNCCYLTVEQHNLDLEKFIILALEYTFTKDFFVSNYQSKCWHPPEFLIS